LLNFVVFWYIFPRFGILYQEKSGNPAPDIHLVQLEAVKKGRPEWAFTSEQRDSHTG
jgi:hypothetical protein